MKIKYTYKLFITLFITFSFLFSSISSFPAIAEGDSYLDTIYRAVDGDNDGTYSDEDIRALEIEKAAETSTGTCSGIVIDTDDPNPTVTIEDPKDDGKKDNEEPLSHVNLVLADMTRILVNMNTGIPINTSSFTIIDLSDDGGTDTGSTSNTCTSTNTDTGSASDTSTNTNTGSTSDTSTNTNTGSSSDTSTNTNTGSASDTSTNTNTGSSSDTSTNTDTGSASDTSTNTDTGSSSDTSSNTDTGSKTDTGTNTNPFDDDTTVTGTDTGTVSGSETKTNTATDTRTDAEKIEDLKAKIQSTYGIKCEDGDSKFSLRQLEIIDEVLGKLPESFRTNTTEMVREIKQEGVEEDPNEGVTLAYVVKPQTKIHILDAATCFTQEDLNEIYERRKDISKAELVRELEYRFAHTIVHEMTHCFNNRNANIGAEWADKFWPNNKITGNPVSSYANSSYSEDLSESVGAYVSGGFITKDENGNDVFRTNSSLYYKTMDMDRYNFIKDKIMGGKEFLSTAPTSGGLSI